ncbi:MAG TPA: WG repeat-containing protein [Planktothrix sp.]|jgi:hypothetical protein
MKADQKAPNIGKRICSIAVAMFTMLFVQVAPSMAAENEKDKLYEAELKDNVDLKKKPDPNLQRTELFFLIDENGKKLKQLNYNRVSPLTEGLAAVYNGDPEAVGYINASGEMVIPIQYKNGGLFEEGLACFLARDGETGYINHDGQKVIQSHDYSDCQNFHDGLAAVRVKTIANGADKGQTKAQPAENNWGYIDKTGKVVIAPQFAAAQDFHEGLAEVELGQDKLIIDHDGKLIDGKFELTRPFAENLAPVEVNGKWGYIDKSGKFALKPQFEDAYYFADGLAGIKLEGKYGLIDHTGKIVIAPKYSDVGSFAEGLGAVKDDTGKWSYIDKTGAIKIAGPYDFAMEFSSGLASVQVSGNYGCIDKAGKFVIQPIYDDLVLHSDKRGIAREKNWNSVAARSDLMELHLREIKIHQDPHSPTGVYIPKNVSDAMIELDKMLPPAALRDIKTIEEEEMISHCNTGLRDWLVKNWGLANESRLYKYMDSQNFSDTDLATDRILAAYWERVHGQSK